ncbi:MAG: hypothetical protein K2I47_03500, partial [Odoribacter sp.]|nr:hypothetical protein [Odoribacter sp.]
MLSFAIRYLSHSLFSKQRNKKGREFLSLFQEIIGIPIFLINIPDSEALSLSRRLWHFAAMAS